MGDGLSVIIVVLVLIVIIQFFSKNKLKKELASQKQKVQSLEKQLQAKKKETTKKQPSKQTTKKTETTVENQKDNLFASISETFVELFSKHWSNVLAKTRNNGFDVTGIKTLLRCPTRPLLLYFNYELSDQSISYMKYCVSIGFLKNEDVVNLENDFNNLKELLAKEGFNLTTLKSDDDKMYVNIVKMQTVRLGNPESVTESGKESVQITFKYNEILNTDEVIGFMLKLEPSY